MIVLPAIGSQFIAATNLFLMPVLINSLQTKAGLSGRAAGWLLSMELVVSAFTTFILCARLRSRSARSWALFGGLLAVAGTALTLVSPSVAVLFVARISAGIGAGIVGAEATSVLSRGIEKEKLIAIATIASIANAAIWLALIPYMVDALGYRGPYVCLLLVCVAGTYLLRRLPSVPNRPGANQPALESPFSSAPVFVLLAIFLTQLGQGAFWSLEETFAGRAGFSGHAIGVLLSVATLMLLVGASAAATVSSSLGRFRSVLTLVAANAFSILLISTTTVHWIFIAANILQSITNLSSVICQLGLAASLDRTGRVVAVSTSLVTLGNGLGPGLSANVSSTFGAPSLGILVLAFNVVALALYCAVKLRATAPSPVPDSLT
jgi:predicted MFS family arabinose efflux permease